MSSTGEYIYTELKDPVTGTPSYTVTTTSGTNAYQQGYTGYVMGTNATLSGAIGRIADPMAYYDPHTIAVLKSQLGYPGVTPTTLPAVTVTQQWEILYRRSPNARTEVVMISAASKYEAEEIFAKWETHKRETDPTFGEPQIVEVHEVISEK